MTSLDEDTWLIELESAILDGWSASEIYALSKGKHLPENLRPEIWQLCLQTHDAANQMINFNEIFDLSNQDFLRNEIKKNVMQFENNNGSLISVTSDIESIITFYCKCNNVEFDTENCWIEILLPLVNLKIQRADTYNMFETIIKRYLPKNCHKNGAPFHVLYFLLQYHDPELCSFLDTKRITPEQYSSHWLKSLFSSVCSLEVIPTMWDIYFQRSEPFYIFFLSLIMVINAREQILKMKNNDKSEIVEFLSKMPSALGVDDVEDFCSLANYYSMKTPASFRNEFTSSLFQTESTNDKLQQLSQMLCLSVSVDELVENATALADINEGIQEIETVRFFLVDCRPAEQYNAGHLSTAFHLDCNLMLQEPSAFDTAVQGLLNAQRQALAVQSLAAGEHLCFVGSGRIEEDSYAHMVVSSFLKRNTKHVSMLNGGYTAIHEYFGIDMIDCLEEHNALKCLVCAPNFKSSSSITNEIKSNASTIKLFGKLSAAMKAKSQEVKGKLIDYIVNPTLNNSSNEWHVSRTEIEKRYRNVTPVFSIDDDYVDNVMDIDNFLKSLDVLYSFRCQEVLQSGYMYDSYLVLTETDLILLRDIGDKRGNVKLISKRPLSSIVKITAKKRHPELITFKYGLTEGENILIQDNDRFLIPNASECTKLVSHQILRQIDKTGTN